MKSAMKISLVKQLSLVSLCTLLLPWTGCQYVREMETLIRQQQSNTLEAFTQPLADSLATHPYFQQSLSKTIMQATPFFAPITHTPFMIDGYADEWLDYYSQEFINADASSQSTHNLRTVIFSEHLYLFVEVEDAQIHYYEPSSVTLKNNDWLRIVTPKEEYRLFTSAPGSTQTLRYDPNSKKSVSDNSVIGNWQEGPRGYQLEIKIPIAAIEDGIKIDIVDHQADKNIILASTSQQPAPLLIPSKALTDGLLPYKEKPWDIQIINSQGWPLLAHTDDDLKAVKLPLVTRDNLGSLLINGFYRFVLEATLPRNHGQQWPLGTTTLSAVNQRIPIEKIKPAIIKNKSVETFSQWYSLPQYNQSALLIVRPITGSEGTLGFILATQTENALLSFTNDALRRVMNLSLATFLIVVFILIGYAAWLSMRIKRLQHASEHSISDDGEITLFTPSEVPDEIGALSQSYADLLQRIKNYNDYLQGLTHKLAHEIRTPLAIVKSSLEMLETVPKDQQKTYLDRALEGNQRLANILNAMSESTQVEQLVQKAEYRPIDILPILKSLVAAYEATYPDFRFAMHTNIESYHLKGNPELLAQMIDKLVDNARDFTPKGATITIHARVTQRSAEKAPGLTIEVINPGSSLPETMAEQLFDSLITVREKKEQAGTHLGLGLYIVRLIVNAHQGSIRAYNLANKQGVCFEITLSGQAVSTEIL